MAESVFGGTEIDPAKKLTWGSERLIYVLHPLFNGTNLDKNCNALIEKADKWAEDKTRTGHLEYLNMYHSSLKGSIEKLKHKKIIFTTAQSVDLTPVENEIGALPRKYCLDMIAHRCRLSDEFMRAALRLQEKKGKNVLEDAVFMQVGPVLAFYQIVLEDFQRPRMEHYFLSEINRVNMMMWRNEKEGFKTIEKTLGENKGQNINFAFSDMLFMPADAQDAFKQVTYNFAKRSLMFLKDDEREKLEGIIKDDVSNMDSNGRRRYYLSGLLGLKDKDVSPEAISKISNFFDAENQKVYRRAIIQSTQLNRKIVCSSIVNTVLAPLGIKKLWVYAERSKYVHSILHYLPKDYQIAEWEPTRNMEWGVEGVCDRSCINRFMGAFAEDGKL